jgi:hypothetical protein
VPGFSSPYRQLEAIAADTQMTVLTTEGLLPGHSELARSVDTAARRGIMGVNSCGRHRLADTRTAPERVGHSDVNARMMCIHVLNRGPAGVASPVDTL